MAFTKQQIAGIFEEGKNIIVSAGAGSGKTAVLTERVIRKLKDGIDIDKLLVLTFTNEAANEMKNRIRTAIIVNKLDRQLDLIDSAYITTFDSYVLSLVKKYHYILNIKKDIKIIDSIVFKIYKYKLLDSIFETEYNNDDFKELINDFCLKDDRNIKDYIIMLSEKLDLLVDKETYLNNYLENNYNEEIINKLIKEYENIIKNNIIELKNIYLELSNYISSELDDKIAKWLKPLFDGTNYEEYLLFNSLPTVRMSIDNEEGIVIKDRLKLKITEIKQLLRFNNINEIKESIIATKKYVKVILRIIDKLDKEINQYKDELSIYEFNDISHMAIKIIKDNPDICEEIKNNFNEIMIDEYQDTSLIQEEFISHIANNNIYMVGDIKQSIYRFRNANPYIFQSKYNAYENNHGGIKIDLIKNFRSRKETLSSINDIFNLIMDDEIGNANYRLTHNMIYGNTLYDEEDNKVDNNLVIYNYEMEEEDKYTKEEKELFIISEDISQKIKAGYLVFDKHSKKLRPVKYSDICIITDRNKYLPLYRRILEYHQIPSIIYMDEEFNNDMITLVIKNLINLVYLVNNNNYDNKFKYMYTSIARSFLFSYQDDVIYDTINNKTYKESDIVKIAKEIKLDKPISVIINDIFNKYHIYEKLTILNNIEKNLILLDNLTNMANNLDDIGYSIPDFINYLDDTINMKLSVKYSSNTSSGDAVKIMNIHKSKGLEFSICYFTGMHNKFTIKDISNKNLYSEKYGIIMPYLKDNELTDTIKKDIYVSDYMKEEISEKIRLLYVALTRCREKIIIVTSLNNDINKYNHLVPKEERMRYRSFLDILNSIHLNNITNKKDNYNKKNEKINLKEIKINNNHELINRSSIKLTYDEINPYRYSKENNNIYNIDEINKLEYGTKMHEELEYHTPDNLLNKLDDNYLNIYHEFEFINNKSRGIIDLMVEYDDKILIIDYKTKNISDKDYQKQLKGYREYIMSISNKTIKTYLYSIKEDILMEVI